MRILMIGAGAVGGYFGARLVQHGRDVTFLVHSRRREQLQRDGLRIGGVRDAFTVQPTLLTAEELAASPTPFDLILLCVKAYSLPQAMEDFASAVGPQTAILPLLNGMGHLEVLAARFGAGSVLGGITRIVADLDAEGRIVLLETLHDITFGELDGRSTPRARAIDAVLSGCGFEAILSLEIRSALWFKWVLLSSTAGITLLGRGTVGEVNRAPGGLALSLAVIAEASSIAAAAGYPLSPKDARIIHKRLTLADSTFVSSLYRDLHRNAPVEADHILGDLLGRAAQFGLTTPLLGAVYTQTKVYEARLATQRESRSAS